MQTKGSQLGLSLVGSDGVIGYRDIMNGAQTKARSPQNRVEGVRSVVLCIGQKKTYWCLFAAQKYFR